MQPHDGSLNAAEPSRVNPHFTALVCGATGLVCLALALKRLDIGVSGEWVWPYAKVSLWDRIWVPAVHFALLAVVLRAALAKKRLTQGEARLSLGLMVCFAFGLQLGTGYLNTVGLDQDVLVAVGPWMGGYHSQALKAQDLPQYLAAYPETIRAMSVKGLLAHVCNHPPGYVFFYWTVDRITEASQRLTDAVLSLANCLSPVPSDVVGKLNIRLSPAQMAGIWLASWALRLFMCLTMVPVYLLARRCYDARAGLAAAAMVPLVPAFHLFSPYPDALIIFLAPVILCLWDRVLSETRSGRAFGLGVFTGAALFGALFSSLAALVLAPIGAIVTGLRLLQGDDRVRLLRIGATAAAAGAMTMAALGALVWLLTGCNLAEVFLVCLQKHSDFYAAVPRSYWRWSFWNVVDFVLFLGIPLAMMSGRTLIRSLFVPNPQGRSQGLVQARFLLAALATLVILDIAGLNRGETARLWMPFMPLFCVNVAASVPSAGRPGASPPALIALMAAQFAQLCALKLCLDVFGLASLSR